MAPPRRRPNQVLKYSGLAFQIFGTLAVAAFLGQWLDKKFKTDLPLFTMGTVIFFFTGIMVWLYKDLQQKKDEE
ncbi:MAG: AtpZ/AtpI family protein [Bacteroidota bacterium]|nr:AtpZ/AtpI family protein [Bacteroidota bacterium]